ncbi:cysteine-rich KTR domain-containing protein [Bifidobacterium longum]|uniref:cysteine-rich KTR domain-containing protein n=1 Tax=Bifidobacterium longum TaxID=216816 RepID=UPI003F899DD0
MQVKKVNPGLTEPKRKPSTGEDNMKIEWILCPFCGSKTRLKIRDDTVLENFPLYCPKCKHETLIAVRQLNLSIIQEPDAKTQSR